MPRPNTECKTCNTFYQINYCSPPPTSQGLYNAYRRRAQGQGQPDILHPYRTNGHLDHEEIARLRPDPEFEKWTPPNPKTTAFRPSVPIVPPHSFETSNEFLVRWHEVVRTLYETVVVGE
ncbi:hypothetical protein ACMFMG_006849 [Clarireedia jacksonii]